eukprot:6004986-Pyramimonas_sp.AAC.1
MVARGGQTQAHKPLTSHAVVRRHCARTKGHSSEGSLRDHNSPHPTRRGACQAGGWARESEGL